MAGDGAGAELRDKSGAGAGAELIISAPQHC